MTDYAVEAKLADGRVVKLLTIRGEGERDWSGLVLGPARSDYVRQLTELGFTQEEARSAEFKATAIP